MGYSHTFYAVDLQQLKALPGSKDLALHQLLVNEGDLAEEELDAAKRILEGNCETVPHTEHLYGYALEGFCRVTGELIRSDCACIYDHPYRSKLVANGLPIEIPDDNNDFPQIGYLDISEIQNELELVQSTPAKARKSLINALLRKLTSGILGREMDDEDLEYDMQEYIEVLQQALEKNLSLVAFRY